MNSKLLVSLILGMSLLVVSAPLLAHHGSNASYNAHKQITMKGTVTLFMWANPHSQIYYDVRDDQGNVAHWGGEEADPGTLKRNGWTKDIMKPGDEITITVCPSKAGTPRGLVARVVLADGRVLGGLAPKLRDGDPGPDLSVQFKGRLGGDAAE